MAAPALPRSQWNHRAIVAPGLASGILYLFFLLIMASQHAAGEVWAIDLMPPDAEGLLAVIPVLGLAAIVGLVLSMAPLLIGVTLLAWLGRWNVGSRHPLFWALVGAAMPAGLFATSGSGLGDPPLSALLCTGAACAALARRYVRWPSSEE